jgi:hypothetical protein
MNEKNEQVLFFVDQFLHLGVIGGVAYAYFPIEFTVNTFVSPQILLLSIALIVTTFVTSICMKVMIAKWKPDEGKTLKNAGSYIGMLERLFIFGFVVMNYWEGIGFLLAAKSVFRFGDLNSTKDRNLTEYILIGTLLSFGCAILIAKGYLVALDGMF